MKGFLLSPPLSPIFYHGFTYHRPSVHHLCAVYLASIYLPIYPSTQWSGMKSFTKLCIQDYFKNQANPDFPTIVSNTHICLASIAWNTYFLTVCSAHLNKPPSSLVCPNILIFFTFIRSSSLDCMFMRTMISLFSLLFL